MEKIYDYVENVIGQCLEQASTNYSKEGGREKGKDPSAKAIKQLIAIG